MDTIKLNDVCEILNGYAFKSANYVNSGIRIIRITNVQNGYIEDKEPRFYPLSREREIQKYILKENDILISLTGNVGRVALLEKKYLPAALNQRVACLRLKNKIIYKPFLFCFLNSYFFENQCITNSKGIAQLNLSTEWLRDYEIPLYEYKSQVQIADKFHAINKLIGNRKRQLELLDMIVKSRFIEMFGDPISNPQGWPVKRLEELSLLITNGNTPKGGSKNYVNKGILFLRSQNVWKNRIDLEDVACIDLNTHANMSKSSVHDKDILITKTGRINTENSSLGRAALFRGADNSANINGHVYLVRLDDTVVPEYVVAILTGEAYRKYIRKVCVGGIDKRQINLDQVENFPIILPPKEKQKQFAIFATQIDKSKLAIQKSIEKLEILKKSLMQKYFG